MHELTASGCCRDHDWRLCQLRLQIQVLTVSSSFLVRNSGTNYTGLRMGLRPNALAAFSDALKSRFLGLLTELQRC